MMCFLLLFVGFLMQICHSAPVDVASRSFVPGVFITNDYYNNKMPRQGPITSWIQSSEWFPIEINIPDTISGIGQGISSGFMTLSNNFQNFIQGLPFFNRFPSQFKPRPYKYYIFVPATVMKGQATEGHYDPFDNTHSDFIPVYP